MCNILAEYLSDFEPDEQRQIEALEKSFTDLLDTSARAGQNVGLMLSMCAGFVFDAYSRVLLKQTDLTSPDSIEKFVAQLDRVSEGVLSKYGRDECTKAITTQRQLAESWAWGTHVLLDQRKGLDIINAAMRCQGLAAPQLAKEMQRQPLLKKAKLKADKTAVHRIIKGETKKPRVPMLKALIAALQLKPDEAAIVLRDLGPAQEVQKS